jgi:hypothetical protein
MDMDNTVSAVKQYWPWALGAIAGFWLLTRIGGGGADTSGDTSGSLYDPNLLANNLAMTQVAAGVQQAQIVADAQNNMAGWGAIASGFGSLANINQDFQSGQIAAYNATRDISISAANNMGNITAAGLLASGEANAAFHNMVGDSTKAAGQIVGGIAGANAASQKAAGSLIGKFFTMGMG